MAYLSLSNISKVFSGVTAVEDFNLEVNKGEFVSFLGPSGCGKTTTLRMIAGFELPTTGLITIDGEDISYKSPNQRNVGMVFQSYALFPNLSVADNISFGLKVRKVAAADIKQRVDEMLSLIHLEKYGSRYPYQLSGGQQQRIALARALAIRPRVLLLDEPLSALDAKIRVELRTEIRRIQRQLGITTIYVTHDQEEALSISDRIVVMSQGHMEQVGSPFEIYNFPQTPFVATFVGTLNQVRARVVDAPGGKVSIDGQTVQLANPLPPAGSEEISLALRPEMLRLNSSQPEANHLDARIENIVFLGSIVRILVRLERTSLFLDTFNNPHLVLPETGAQVQVSFPKEACLVLGSVAQPVAG